MSNFNPPIEEPTCEEVDNADLGPDLESDPSTSRIDETLDLDAIATESQKRLDEARALLAHIQKARPNNPNG